MSRPTKNNADWFSHDTDLRNHRVIKVARNKWGADWYAVFCMLLETLTNADEFTIELTQSEIQVIAADFGITEDVLTEMIEFFVWFDLIQKKENSIYSQHLIDRMQPLLKKRRTMRAKYVQEKTPAKLDESPPKQPPKKTTMTEEQFEAFWSAYPKKEDKKKAKTKFLKLESSLLPKILESIARNKIENRKWKEGYIKNPLTWINGENWNDEIETIKPNNEPHTPKHSQPQTGKISSTGTADDEVTV